jgi:hypothetical protein
VHGTGLQYPLKTCSGIFGKNQGGFIQEVPKTKKKISGKTSPYRGFRISGLFIVKTERLWK